MSGTGKDAFLQELWVGTVLHHLDIVVGLNHQMVRLADILLHLVRHATRIRHQTEIGTCSLDEVAHIVGTIVRHAKGCHREVAQLQRHALLHYHRLFGSHLLHHAVVAVDAVVHLPRCIDGHLVVVTEGSHRLDVVSMIVSDQHMPHAGETDAIVATGFLQTSQPYPYVDEQGVCRGCQQIAVTAASTTKRDKFQHDSL